VTLIELLVVLTLMATLLGLGISMYTNLGKQGVFSATTARALATLNRVRNSSMSHPAALQVNAGDPEKGLENSIRGVEFVPMFGTQCEPPSKEDPFVLVGALDRNGTLPPGADFRPGVVGQGLWLAGGGAVDCGNHPAFDATEGVAVDVWVYPETDAGGTLIQRGDGLVLSLIRQGSGPGIRFELAFASGPKVAGGASIESATVVQGKFEPAGVVLPLKRWSRIVAAYDRSAVVISLDTGHGPVERLRERETAPLAPSRKSHLFVGGGGGTSFRGGIDGIRIEGVLGESYEPFPPQVLVDGPTRRIRYLQGKLDPAFHTRPETITLRYGQRVREIVIGLEGNVVSK
jgi:hypothetical protein